MSIDASPTINALKLAIETTDTAFRQLASGYLPPSAADARAVQSIGSRPEITEARTQLSALKSASSAYADAVSNWTTNYRTAFTTLDRYARFVLSLTTATPAAIPFATDAPTHALLVARASLAAASAVHAEFLAKLAAKRSDFDAKWEASSTVDAAEATLTAAIAAADRTVVYLVWAKANP